MGERESARCAAVPCADRACVHGTHSWQAVAKKEGNYLRFSGGFYAGKIPASPKVFLRSTWTWWKAAASLGP